MTDRAARDMTLEAVAQDPLWFPNAISGDLRHLQLVRVTAEELIASPFLDARRLTGSRASAVVDFAAADLTLTVARLRAANPPAAFIFHNAFCRSTLLAAALQETGACLALSEPDILRQSAHLIAAGGAGTRLIGQVILGLLQRPVEPGQRVVIKPSNMANPWLRWVIAEGLPVLLIYGALEDFLVSILLREEPGRVFAREIFAMLAADGAALSRIEPSRALLLTDLQVAALAWRQQMEVFAAACGAGQARSLRSEDLATRPGETLLAACQFLGVAASPAAVDEIVRGPLFQRDAKHPGREFDGARHGETRGRIARLFGDSLSETAQWAGALRLEHDLVLPLSSALLAA